MAVSIRLTLPGGEVATLDNGVWQCADPNIQHSLNSLYPLKLYPDAPGDSIPAQAIAAAQATRGVLKTGGVSGIEGRIY